MYTAILTGSRKYSDWPKVNETMQELHDHCEGQLFVRVGDCSTGLDEWVRIWCERNSVPYKEYTAYWHEHGKAAGPIRNGEMVADGGEVCIAFPDDESKGTRDCAEKAKAAGIPVNFPDLPEWADWAIPLMI